MKFYPRTLAATIRKAARTFPAVVITGPRQSGKTTLLRHLFSKTHRFLGLEDPDIRMRAKEDPRGFLSSFPLPIILDEIQYVPELLSYIKTEIDRRRTPGQWILTGSQSFPLMHNVSQSLAGRAAILSLLPFSFAERIGNGGKAKDPEQWLQSRAKNTTRIQRKTLAEVILRGSYPEIASRKRVNRQLWCGSYVTTYLERDIRTLASVGDLSQFEIFLKLCAARTGQILNLTELARDAGVSDPTAKRWLSMLETGYQILLLRPFHRNIGKRLIKAPKLYFNDTGLASYLLGLHDPQALLAGPSFGPLFETLVITDVWKRFLHSGATPSMYYLRSRDGLEIDLIIEWNGKLHLFEIKAGETLTSRHAAAMNRLVQDLGAQIASASLISLDSTTNHVTRSVGNRFWQELMQS